MYYAGGKQNITSAEKKNFPYAKDTENLIFEKMRKSFPVLPDSASGSSICHWSVRLWQHQASHMTASWRLARGTAHRTTLIRMIDAVLGCMNMRLPTVL